MIARAQAGEPVTEQIWLDLVSKEIGEQGLAVHRAMMAGGVMLPDSDAFGPCFKRTTKTIRRFDLGFDPMSLVGDVKTIKGLMAGSEAEKAGVRNGDVVTYRQALDSAQGEMIARVRVSAEQRRGCVFVPMHWSDEFASAGRVNALVAAHVDPISGQPESKQTPVAVTPYAARWRGFLMTRERMAPPGEGYWTLGRGEGH